jgi:hypothetical protein
MKEATEEQVGSGVGKKISFIFLAIVKYLHDVAVTKTADRCSIDILLNNYCLYKTL